MAIAGSSKELQNLFANHQKTGLTGQIVPLTDFDWRSAGAQSQDQQIASTVERHSGQMVELSYVLLGYAHRHNPTAVSSQWRRSGCQLQRELTRRRDTRGFDAFGRLFR